MDTQTNAAELKKLYGEAVQRTGRFAVSTLVILAILAVIVLNELENSNTKSKRLRRDVISTTERLDRCMKAVDANRPRIAKRLSSLRDQPDLFGETKVTLDVSKKYADSEFKAIEELQSSVTKRLGKESEPGKIDRNSTLIIQLEELAGLLKTYKKDYHDCLSLSKSSAIKRKEMLDMTGAKQSIPTPFGSFEVPPRLALIALAFATVLTYTSFIISVLRLHNIAVAYFVLRKDGSVEPLDRFFPAWLYGANSRSLLSLFSQPKGETYAYAISLSIHTVWLLFAFSLLHQAETWKSYAALISLPRQLPQFTLLSLFGLAVLLAAVHFLPLRRDKSLLETENASLIRYSRRRYIFGIVAGGLLAIGTYFLVSHRAKRRAPPCRVTLEPSLPVGHSNDFVVNKKNQVVHHALSCKRHLPSRKNRGKLTSSGTICLHAGDGVRIIEQVALRNITDKQFDLAIKNLLSAINLAPHSFHLYDKLIGLYGRLKLYGEIDKLLQQAVSAAKQVQIHPKGATKRTVIKLEKNRQRAIREFELRSAACVAKQKRSKSS